MEIGIDVALERRTRGRPLWKGIPRFESNLVSAYEAPLVVHDRESVHHTLASFLNAEA